MALSKSEIDELHGKTSRSLAKTILHLRLENKWSREELAWQAKVSEITVIGIESGQSNPTMWTLLALASAFDLDVDELIGKVV